MKLKTHLSFIQTLIVLVFFWSFTAICAQDRSSNQKEILVIHSGEQGRPYSDIFDKSFKSTLKNISDTNAALSVEYLDLKRFKTDDYKNLLEQLLKSKYQKIKPDIVVITHIEAVNYIYERNLFPKTPKILIDINCDISIKDPDATVIPSAYNFNKKIKHALDVFPKTEAIYVIAGTSESDKNLLNTFKSQVTVHQEKIAFTYLTEIDKTAILKRINNLSENSLIYLLAYTQEYNGSNIIARDFISQVAEHANRPVFTFIDLLAEGTGVFGGLVSSIGVDAEKSVDVISKVFNGQNIENIQAKTPGQMYLYDWNEIQKWQVDIKKLPKERIIQNHTLTFFELYKYEIIIGFIILVLYSFLLSMLMFGNLKRKKIASDLMVKNKELVKAKEKAQESDQLKSAFLSNMGHEIRTPMNGILGFSELLKNPNLSGLEQQKYIQIIEKSGARMLNTINDIIDISKIESGLVTIQKSEVDINKLLHDFYLFFEPEAKQKNIELHYVTPLQNDDAIIKTDHSKLNGILSNLIKNAVKFTNYGSIHFGYNLINENTQLKFYIKDTGIGIPENRRTAVFERFIQADIEDKMALQGSGLGLAITKSYVELLGGHIWVKSEVDVGTSFYFTLPYTKGELLQEGAPNVVKNIEHNTSNLNILIVEDDTASSQYLSIILREFAKEINIVNNGEDAVNVCKNNADIDLILMDIQLPIMDGYEASKQIRVFNKNVVIISQTAYALSDDKDKSIAAGCNDYISKPVNKDKLKTLIKKHIKKQS